MSEEKSESYLAKMPLNYDKKEPWKCCWTKSAEDVRENKTKRQRVAEALTAYFQNNQQQSVIGVNGGWGSGKTTFLRMWSDDLALQEIHCIYFNAWEYDFAEIPLLAFITSLEKDNANDDKQKTFIDKVKPYLADILSKLVENATRGVLTKVAKDCTTNLLGLQEKHKSREEFKKALEELAGNNPKKPLIIMVDELDRCKPSFAVALMEDIKHLFCVKNIKFVLAVEKTQLCNVMSSVYGLKTAKAGHEYLGKFIDMYVELPEVNKDLFLEDRSKQLEDDYRRHWFRAIMAVYDELSLRDIEQIVNRIALLKRNSIFSASLFHIFMVINMQRYSLDEIFQGNFLQKNENSVSINVKQVIEFMSEFLTLKYKFRAQCDFKIIGNKFVSDGLLNLTFRNTFGEEETLSVKAKNVEPFFEDAADNLMGANINYLESADFCTKLRNELAVVKLAHSA